MYVFNGYSTIRRMQPVSDHKNRQVISWQDSLNSKAFF